MESRIGKYFVGKMGSGTGESLYSLNVNVNYFIYVDFFQPNKNNSYNKFTNNE